MLFAGIGENGHLAFNDPPADFVTTDPYIIVHSTKRAVVNRLVRDRSPGLRMFPRPRFRCRSGR